MTRVHFAAIFLFLHIIECHRIHLSDSIMDIINTQHVEKILADRRQQQMTAATSSNNLEEEEDAGAEETDTYPTSDTIIDFDYNTNQPPRIRVPLPIRGDVVVKYNDTSIIPSLLATRYPNVDPNLIDDLQKYRGDKILKSSKSALFIAKKELLKQDWCKTEPFEQKIREDGCYSKRITNNFCYGQCNSFYIPKMTRRRRKVHGKQQRQHHNKHQIDSFRSCAYCKPKEYSFIVVILKCPSLTPTYRRKRVQVVKECRCIAQNAN